MSWQALIKDGWADSLVVIISDIAQPTNLVSLLIVIRRVTIAIVIALVRHPLFFDKNTWVSYKQIIRLLGAISRSHKHLFTLFINTLSCSPCFPIPFDFVTLNFLLEQLDLRVSDVDRICLLQHRASRKLQWLRHVVVNVFLRAIHLNFFEMSRRYDLVLTYYSAIVTRLHFAVTLILKDRNKPCRSNHVTSLFVKSWLDHDLCWGSHTLSLNHWVKHIGLPLLILFISRVLIFHIKAAIGPTQLVVCFLAHDGIYALRISHTAS